MSKEFKIAKAGNHSFLRSGYIAYDENAGDIIAASDRMEECEFLANVSLGNFSALEEIGVLKPVFQSKEKEILHVKQDKKQFLILKNKKDGTFFVFSDYFTFAMRIHGFFSDDEEKGILMKTMDLMLFND